MCETLLYSGVCGHYEITKILLEAGTQPYLHVPLQALFNFLPDFQQKVKHTVGCFQNEIGNAGETTELCTWQVTLLKDDLHLLKQIESLTGFNNAKYRLPSDHTLITKADDVKIFPVHDACLFKAYSCLEYLLKNSEHRDVFYHWTSDDAEQRKQLLTSLFWLSCKDTKLLALLFVRFFIHTLRRNFLILPRSIETGSIHVASCSNIRIKPVSTI